MLFVDASQHRGCSVPLMTTSPRVMWAVPRSPRVYYTQPDLTAPQHACVLVLSSAAGACAAALLAWLRRVLDVSVPRLRRALGVPLMSAALLRDARAMDAASRATLTAPVARPRLLLPPSSSSQGVVSRGATMLRRGVRACVTHAAAIVRFAVATSAEYAYCLAACIVARDVLCARAHCHNACAGVVAGAVAGASYALMRHPYDVLCSTATAASALRTRSGDDGPWWVLRRLWAQQRQQQRRRWPSSLLRLLRELYKGVAVVAAATCLRLAVQFGLYNAVRYRAAQWPSVAALYAYCYAAALLGLLVEYPVLGMTHQLRVRNSAIRGPRVGYLAHFAEQRRRYGVTKMYDGFFAMRPLLSALAPALLLTCYDVAVQRAAVRQREAQRRRLLWPSRSDAVARGSSSSSSAAQQGAP